MSYGMVPPIAGRLPYSQRPNPDTGEQEFAFQFHPGEPYMGWYSVNQIQDASQHAIDTVFDQVLAASWPEHAPVSQEPT